MKSCNEFEKYWPWMSVADGVSDDWREEFVARLEGMGEFYAAGFFAEKDASLYRRLGLGLLRVAQETAVMQWEGDLLFPVTRDRRGRRFWCEPTSDDSKRPIISYHYNTPWQFNWGAFEAKVKIVDAEDRRVLEAVGQFERDWMVGAGGYTHCCVNYERVLREGFGGIADRIESKLSADDIGDEKREFYRAMRLVVEAAEVICGKLVCAIDGGDGDAELKARLISSLERGVRGGAESFYDAMVLVNFVYYFEGCDSPGRMDQYLLEYYLRDRESGEIDDGEVIRLLKEFWRNIDRTDGWNVAIGGSDAGGKSSVNELTFLILESVKGLRRPNLALRIPVEADDRLWNALFDSIATGNGLPALYNDDLYVRTLKDFGLGLSDEDVREISFGGCTETMIHGKSNVGSLAGTLGMLAILEKTIGRWLGVSKSFEEFLEHYFNDLEDQIDFICDEINLDNEVKARKRPQLVRSLLVDDCIESGVEFCRGGARYNWEVVGIEGFSNVIDSLVAIKAMVFDERRLTGRKFKQILWSNFVGHGDVLASILKLPRYGQGKQEVDEIARRVGKVAFEKLKSRDGWRGGKFMAGCLMFETYAICGKSIGATPDGRLAGEPLGDSFGAYQGRDKFGPTALLNSVTSIDHTPAAGTLVVNMRFSSDMLSGSASRAKLRALIETYFARGGMQIQVTVANQAVLEAAMAEPKLYEDLIVRIGGYSVYFTELTVELQRSVLERSIHEV